MSQLPPTVLLTALCFCLAACDQTAGPAGPEVTVPPAGGAGGAAPPSGGAGGATSPEPTPVTPRADAAAPAPGPVDAGVDAAAPGPDAAAGPGPGAPHTAAVVPSPACAAGAMLPGPNGNQTIMATGKSRTFIIHMPTGYDGKRPFPVLFAFHGAGGGASAFEGGAFAGVNRMAADKAVRIFPQALGGTWARDEPDDVKFMDAIIEWLGTRICYDKARVFASGQSSGSYFSHRFACDRGELLRAVATSSGGQRRERALDCKVPVSAWLSNGASDNPGHVMGTQQARDVWAKLAGCTVSGPTTPAPPGPCVSYPGCREGYSVVYCQHPGGHPFPSYGTAGVINFLFSDKN